MAAVGRESRFMPTVKCSTCSVEVEISLMGEHLCTGSESPAESTPPMPATSLFGRLMPTFGNPLTQKQQPRAPPQVDTSAANRAFTGQPQLALTPISGSSGSQSSISPQTPNGRPGTAKADEFFSPQIANNSPPPPQSTRPGGYGGLDDSNGDELPAFPVPPKRQGPNLLDRMNNNNNTLNTPVSPFDPPRRPSAAGLGGPIDANERPGTSASNVSSGLGSGKMPRAKNGYGGFAPPSKAPESEPPATPNRSETFPRPSDRFAPPPRTPSAPLSSATLRPERLQLPTASPGAPDGQSPMTGDRPRRPSRGPDTSRPPPPRTSTIRPTTPGVPTINLAAEFGIGNPYHNSSESSSSSNSENSSQPERRPSQASQASSTRTSPPRSLHSRSGKNASDTSSFDNLMSDIQTSMDDMNPKQPPTIAPLKLPPRDMRDRPSPSPLSARPPRSAGRSDRGYDPRIDPAIQNPRPGTSPLPSPMPATPLQESLAVQTPSDTLSPNTAGPPNPQWANSPDPTGGRRPSQADRRPSHAQDRRPSQAQDRRPSQAPDRRPSQAQPSPKLQPPAQFQPFRPSPSPQPQLQPPPQFQQPPPSRSQPSPQYPPPPQLQPPPHTPSARGSCKACNLPIKGKSISSADGRLTGRYHKPCFVCSTCASPFTTSTFYVLDDRPYCELHYHKLNGSLCGSCGRGIEGQYLEQEEAGVKHHVGCFKCGDCGMALRDGYFEVGGKVVCEKDAWRLAGGHGGPGGPGGPGGGHGPGPGPGGYRPPAMGLPGGPRMGGGGYNPSRLGPMGPPGPRPKMEKRMTRLGMM